MTAPWKIVAVVFLLLFVGPVAGIAAAVAWLNGHFVRDLRSKWGDA